MSEEQGGAAILQKGKAMQDILFVSGTRPEIIKLAPLYHCLRVSGWARPHWLHTGQHGEMARQMLAETPPEQIKPQPLVRGDDLIAQGYKPGPVFKEILQAVEDAQLEGRIQSREQALQLVAEQFPSS